MWKDSRDRTQFKKDLQNPLIEVYKVHDSKNVSDESHSIDNIRLYSLHAILSIKAISMTGTQHCIQITCTK